MDHELQAIANIWQPSCVASMSEDDAREIRNNVVGFFRVLAEWQEQDAQSGLP